MPKQMRVIRANAGTCQGLEDGMLLDIADETPAYFFLRAPIALRSIGDLVKVSKKTGKGSRYRAHNAPTFVMACADAGGAA